ncbi:MAG: cysteine--tRNA ligase [Firmicutes bacterium]|nr:cysteine--tRNA ligase [Bacillota bacterium]
MKLYNTLTRQKEEFTPLKQGLVTMYSCGPTVYGYAHIGNLRTYVFMDLARRALKLCGYKIKGVLNITDVGHLTDDSDDGEDKMALTSKREQKSPWEIAEYYTKVFFEDCAKLNIGKPEIIAKATDHIQEMLSYVYALCDKGFGYETEDGIYYDIQKFEGYGKLSRINLDEQLSGARVDINTEKRHPADFALWKKAEKNHIMQWDSKWGMGYPGWHIECSAMSKKYLGAHFDIHSGGVDHIPIHHENEIAQNEALTDGKPAVNVWLHGEFMLVDGGKMGKSLGNGYTIKNLEERGYHALDFRMFCLNAHYRKKLNFTFSGLDGAKTSRMRLLEALALHKSSATATPKEKLESYKADFMNAVEDDINAPRVLGLLFTMIKEPKSKDIYALALEFDKLLGLDLHILPEPKKEEEPLAEDIPAEILALSEKRTQAKKDKNFALSDQIRNEILAKGYTVIDTANGVKIVRNA